MKGRRVILPLLLIAVGMILLNGCLPIPLVGSYDTPYGVRPDKVVGESPDNMLRLGRATEREVVSALGSPAVVGPTGRYVYVFPVNTGGVYWLGCWTERSYDNRWLVMQFEGERLAGAQTYNSIRAARRAAETQAVPDPHERKDQPFSPIPKPDGHESQPFKPARFYD